MEDGSFKVALKASPPSTVLENCQFPHIVVIIPPVVVVVVGVVVLKSEHMSDSPGRNVLETPPGS